MIFVRLRNVKNAKEKLLASSYYIAEPTKWKGMWREISEHLPIHVEIGTGKGQFLIQMAIQYPEIFFIGIEKYESVLVRAIEKVNDLELTNIKFICFDAQKLDTVFDKEINTIYLNFSDPWPKSRHAKRRLTSPIFLEVYDKIFENTKTIIQKTDNIDLFRYSLESMSQHGYSFEKISFDLEKESIFNIETEYEKKFKNLGFKINYVKGVKK